MSFLQAALFLSIYLSTPTSALPTLSKRKGGGGGGGGKARGGGGGGSSSSSSSMTPQQWKLFGIVIGSLIGAAIIGYIVWHIYVHRRRKAAKSCRRVQHSKSEIYGFQPVTEKRFTFSNSVMRRDQYSKVPSPIPSPGYPPSYSSYGSETSTYNYEPIAPGRALLYGEPNRYSNGGL